MREPHEVARVGVLIAMIGGRGALEDAWHLYSRARIVQGSEYAAHIFWSKIERRVLVAVLDELQLQLGALPRVDDVRYAYAAVVETWRLVRDRQRYPAESLIGLDENRSKDALRCLQNARLERDCVEHVEASVRCAAAALCLHRDPLVLWDYMLEQLWLSAHDKTGGEAGMAQRLHDALVTIFEEAQ